MGKRVLTDVSKHPNATRESSRGFSGQRSEGICRNGRTFLQSKCEKWLKHEKVWNFPHAHMHTPYNSKGDHFITAFKMNMCEWVLREIMSKCDFKSNRTRLRKIAWGGSTLPGDDLILTGGPATEKNRDQLETTVNICISSEAQGVWLTVRSGLSSHQLKKWVKKTYTQRSLLDDGCN